MTEAAAPGHTDNSVARMTSSVVAAVSAAVHGKDDIVRTALKIVLAGGHILFEDVPGVGKTMLAKSLGAALGGAVRRIQCTPDLLPSDVTGTSVYDQRTSEFSFRAGPVFANVVIADEINRAEPKAQSALLECMSEQQVTVDGKTYRLPEPFTVVATQNPHEMHGTFPLPEAQRDRFMAKLSLGYAATTMEAEIVMNPGITAGSAVAQRVLTAEQTQELVTMTQRVALEPAVANYLVSVISATRTHSLVSLGASTRAAVHLGKMARANALMAGRNYVIPDDVRECAPVVLSHRLVLAPQARGSRTPASVIDEILASVSPDAHVAHLGATSAHTADQESWR